MTERAMPVPKLTGQDQALLDFVNLEITETNFKEARELLEALAPGYLCFGTTFRDQDVWEKLDETRQDLRQKQALDFHDLDSFQRETQILLRTCISHRQKQPSDLPWTKAKVIVRLRDKRRKNPKGEWPTRFDIQPWTTPQEIAQRQKKLSEDRQVFQARQGITDFMRESGKTLEEVHQFMKDFKRDQDSPPEPPSKEEIQRAEEFIREPLPLEQGIAYKLGVSKTDVEAVLKVFDTNKRSILDAYRKKLLKLVHAFSLAKMFGRYTEGEVSDVVEKLLSPDQKQQATEEDRITLKNLEDETIPPNVQRDLNERIMRCRLAFDFKSGKYGLGFVEYDQEKLYPTNQEDKDPRIQAAPAIAEFLHLHVERLDLCERPECRAFFVSKKKGRKRFCSDACKHLYWQKVRDVTGYHRLDMRKRRDPDTPGFDKYIR